MWTGKAGCGIVGLRAGRAGWRGSGLWASGLWASVAGWVVGCRLRWVGRGRLWASGAGGADGGCRLVDAHTHTPSLMLGGRECDLGKREGGREGNEYTYMYNILRLHVHIHKIEIGNSDNVEWHVTITITHKRISVGLEEILDHLLLACENCQMDTGRKWGGRKGGGGGRKGGGVERGMEGGREPV